MPAHMIGLCECGGGVGGGGVGTPHHTITGPRATTPLFPVDYKRIGAGHEACMSRLGVLGWYWESRGGGDVINVHCLLSHTGSPPHALQPSDVDAVPPKCTGPAVAG